MGHPEIDGLRVIDLKELCKKYDLEIKGRKAELQSRLREYFEANPIEEEALEDEAPPSEEEALGDEVPPSEEADAPSEDVDAPSEDVDVPSEDVDAPTEEDVSNVKSEESPAASDDETVPAEEVADIKSEKPSSQQYEETVTDQLANIKSEQPSSQDVPESDMDPSDLKTETQDSQEVPEDEVDPSDLKTETQDTQEVPEDEVCEVDPMSLKSEQLDSQEPEEEEEAMEEEEEAMEEPADENVPDQPAVDPSSLKTEQQGSHPVVEADPEDENRPENEPEVELESSQEAMETDSQPIEEPTPVGIDLPTPDTMDIDDKKQIQIEETLQSEKESCKKDDRKTERRKKSRWTQEAPEVKVGVQVSGPAVEKAPVARTDDKGNRLTKAQRKKLKKKRRKGEKKTEGDSGVETGNDSGNDKKKSNKKDHDDHGFEIDYIAEEPELNPGTLQFRKVFDAFRAAEMVQPDAPKKNGYQQVDPDGDPMEQDSDDDDKKGNDPDKLSKKKLKKQSRLTVAELKQIVERPDLVEMHDVTSMDPKLLVLLKSGRNTVPVPRHWSYKRKYLSGKRGIEKPPFELPEFIKKTGIMEMREALQQKEAEQSMKTKMRQRVRPKLGKIDIDYQKLHDAFFRYQTKPKMTRHGDIYYEGKEYETRLRELKPGELTDDLRTALGMPLGNNAHKVPPPWLIAMQRYGPPPSYPNLKIPGLNAPIPSGCSFGYHAGGWGKPPVDERGRPLYGDVFGVDVEDTRYETEKPSEVLWGEMESDSGDSSSGESEEESEDEGDQDGTGIPTAADPLTMIDSGLMTPSGLISEAPGASETPIELRKPLKPVDLANPPPLYQVLEEKKAAVGKGMMGTGHIYDLSKKGDKGTEVAINPEDLELDPAALAAKYQSRSSSSKGGGGDGKEDLSDMMSDHLNKTARDRKRKQVGKDSDQKSKKYKDFKF